MALFKKPQEAQTTTLGAPKTLTILITLTIVICLTNLTTLTDSDERDLVKWGD